MQNNYLIPANTKKSQLIFGFFTPVDLALFGISWFISLVMVAFIQNLSFGEILLLLMPGFIATFLVLPVVHYHNILQLITNIVNFYGNRRKYYWRGWCVEDESEQIKQ